MDQFKRREFLKLAGVATALSLAGCAGMGGSRGRVVVIGAGFGGATAAHYIRMWDPGIEVVMVERETRFTSCPMSNLVIGGHRRIDETQRNYDGLRRFGVQVINDEAVSVDAGKRMVRLARGGDLSYDRLIVSPGIDFMYDQIGGYAAAMVANRVVHAWKAGPQTLELRAQLERMPDGGVYLIAIPPAPYRCPPGPYERISQVASYFKVAKPRSKVLALDANADVTSKGALFKKAWADLYPGMIEYRGQARVVAVDGTAMSVRTEFDTIKGDVLNVIPPHRAGEIAVKAGLITHNDRWCDVDWRSCESKAVKNIHVLGDATLSAPGMPKSGHMANQQAKVCAAAVIALMNGHAPSPSPVVTNTCYSYVSGSEVIHVASVHQWDSGQGTLIPVKGAGGVSPAHNELEGKIAWAWAQNIWADMFG
jgi:sulfide dehydrogenase [flavocytochrome c] flavoprotein chain